jgi:hypothetical protein
MRVKAVMLCAVVQAACSEGPGGWTGTVETLANGARLVRNPEAGEWAAGDRDAWALEEELRIGTQEGGGPDVFGAIGGVFVDGAGRIHVIESQAREVRVFGQDGAPVRVIGREGAGPGEFRSPGGVFWDDAGSMWVPDAANARYTRFDSGGSLLETRPRESRALGGGPFRGGLTDGGVLYDTDLEVPEASADLPPLMLAAGMGGARLVLRAMFALDGRAVSDTVDLPEATVEPVTFMAPGIVMGSPFNTRMHVLFDRRGSLWFGESHAYRIHQRTLAGDTVLVIERAHTAEPVRADDIDEWLRSEGVERFRERGGTLDAERLQKVKPVFDGLFLDDSGHLWVRLLAADEAIRFDVFDPDGVYLGAVEGMPGMGAQAPAIVGDRFHAVVRDSLDVPYVVRYRVRGRVARDGT